MQDLRAAPRWSKTAVIVVLVVFGLVLLVAVFGLWAFTSQRERDDAKARENAFADGRSLLERVPLEIGDNLEGILTRVRKIVDPALERQASDEASRTFEQFMEGKLHGPLTRGAWRVGREGDVSWLGGRFLLWDRIDRIEERARQQSREWEEQDVRKTVARTAYQRGGPLAALGHWATLAAEHGLAASEEPEEAGRSFPDGMGYAVRLVTLAAEAAGVDPDGMPPHLARDAVLRALEVESLNRVRRARLTRSFEAYAQEIEDQTARLLGHLPPAVRDPLAWEVQQYRASREFFALRKPDNYASLITARDRAQKEHPSHHLVVVSEGDQVFGVEQHRADVTFMVLFDKGGLEHLVAATLAKAGEELRHLGLEARWMPITQTPRIEGFDGRSHAVQLTGRIRLPYQLAIFQTGDPRTEVDGFTNLLFSVVIGLAVAGLVTGGYVLVRLLTREIRLARLKADFVSNLSHELKTPITSMLLFTEMLEEGKLTRPEDQEEAFSVLGQESRRLQRIVNRMIDVARGEARQSPYSLAPADLNRVVLEAATRFRRIVTEPGLDLSIDLVPDRLPVQMDLQAMDDVVTNLLSNAWKYKRGDRARVVVRTVRSGRLADIVVADDGLGIPRADRRKVFEMFYRSDHYLTHPVAGTGLGLALVRSVVAGHKGRIDVQAGEGGVGSVFRVRIPLDRRAHEALQEAEAEQTGESPLGSSPHGMVEEAHGEPAPSGAAKRGSTT